MYNSPRGGVAGVIIKNACVFFFLLSFFLERKKKNKKSVELFLMGRETYLG